MCDIWLFNTNTNSSSCAFSKIEIFIRVLGLSRTSDIDSSFAEFSQICFMFTLMCILDVDENARTAHSMSCISPSMQPVGPIGPATVPNHFQGGFEPFYCLLAVQTCRAMPVRNAVRNYAMQYSSSNINFALSALCESWYYIFINY